MTAKFSPEIARASEDLVLATRETCADWMKEVPDPRLPKRVVYPLPEILFVLFIGQICGLDDVGEIALFAKIELDWFRQVMPFADGAAPAQTIRRVLAQVDTGAFEKLFTAWAGNRSHPCPADWLMASCCERVGRR